MKTLIGMKSKLCTLNKESEESSCSCSPRTWTCFWLAASLESKTILWDTEDSCLTLIIVLNSKNIGSNNFYIGKIADIVCNDNVVLMLSKDGVVYSWGTDYDKTGVLGIGRGIHEQLNPWPLYNLIDFSITKVNINNNKAWVIDKEGRLFLWGLFNTSQLTTDIIIIPQPLFVEALQHYYITKATPYSNKWEDGSDEVGTNICFKTIDLESNVSNILNTTFNSNPV